MTSDTKKQIAQIKEQLVTKHMLFRSINSQVQDPQRLHDIIARREKEIEQKQADISRVKDILAFGECQLDDLQLDIDRLIAKLRELEQRPELDKFERVFRKLVDLGMVDKDGNVLVDCKSNLDRYNEHKAS